MPNHSTATEYVLNVQEITYGVEEERTKEVDKRKCEIT
jgi:hypothetical protein